MTFPRRGHLWKGTLVANNLDMAAKGSAVAPPHLSGAANAMAKLTEKDVVEIRTRYATGMVTQEHLAAEYGVARGHVGRIVSGQWWQHAGGIITKGQSQANPAVTPEMILSVHAAMADGYPSQRALSRQWGVARSVIKSIMNGRFDR